jgi:hypothetical protein
MYSSYHELSAPDGGERSASYAGRSNSEEPREPMVQEVGWVPDHFATLTTEFRNRTTIPASSSPKRDLNSYFRKNSIARTLPVGYERRKVVRFAAQDSEQCVRAEALTEHSFDVR